MMKEVSTLTAIPKIGDKVEIRHQDGIWYLAEICSEGECCELAPKLFTARGNVDLSGFPPEIVCYKHDQPVDCANARHGPVVAGFMIARFGIGPDYEYNYNLRMRT